MSPQFNRLVWKEYRAQRTLWIVLAAAALFVALVMAFTVSNYTPNLANPLIAFSIVLTVAFATASSALAFVAEEEEGTAIWIRQFPVRTSTLFSAKLLVTIVGSAALFLFCSIMSCLVLIALRAPGKSAVTQILQVESLFDAGCTFAGGLSFLTIAVFWSLRSRKVFTALGWSGTFFTLYAILAANSENGTLSPLPLILLLCFALLTVRSVKRWHLGLAPADASAAKASERLSLWFLQRPSARFRKRSAKTLACWAQTPTLLGRTAKTILWRELHFALPFTAWCLGLGLIVVLSRYVHRLTDISMPLFVFLGLISIECGLRTFRHDQQNLHGLFWSHRGVSPALVGLIRNAVWLGVLLTTCLTLTIVEESFLFFHESDQYARNHIPSVMRMCEGVAGMCTGHQYSNIDIPVLNLRIVGSAICLTWVIGVFAVSQLCACWIRKPIIATFAGLVASGLFICWFGFLCLKDIPVWITVCPFVVILFIAGFVTRRQWMDRRMSWKIAGKRLAWVVIPALCMIPIQRWWRVFQIPSTVVTGMDAAAFERFGYSAQNARGTVPDAWETFVLSAGPAFSPSRYPTMDSVLMPEGEQLTRALTALDAILNSDLAETRLPPNYRVPWSRHHIAAGSSNVLLGHAGQQLKNGNIDEALRRTIQSVRLNRYLTQEATSWAQLWEAVTYQRFALLLLRDAVADDRVTEEQLDRVSEQFHALESTWSSDFNVITNRLVVYSQLLSRQGYLWEHYKELRSEAATAKLQAWPNSLINSNSAERHRVLKLMQLFDCSNAQSSFTDSPQRLNANESASSASFIVDTQRWVFTSVYEETDLSMDWIHSMPLGQSAGDRLYRDTVNAGNVTRIVIALQCYRRRHGVFPDSLNGLLKQGLDLGNFRDCDSHVPFGYAPEGFGSPLPIIDTSGRPRAIAATQPIIWSHGDGAPSNTQQFVDTEKHRVNPVEPGRIIFVSGSHLMNDLYSDYFWRQNISDLEKSTDNETADDEREGPAE